MKLVWFMVISCFMSSLTEACDVRFIIQNETERMVAIDGSELGCYAVPKFLPKEVSAGSKVEIVLAVEPEMFDSCKKEKIKLLIDNCDVTDILIDFPLGSALLSAIARNTSNSMLSSRSVKFISDQICGRSTKWHNTIIVKSVE